MYWADRAGLGYWGFSCWLAFSSSPRILALLSPGNEPDFVGWPGDLKMNEAYLAPDYWADCGNVQDLFLCWHFFKSFWGRRRWSQAKAGGSLAGLHEISLLLWQVGMRQEKLCAVWFSLWLAKCSLSWELKMSVSFYSECSHRKPSFSCLFIGS